VDARSDLFAFGAAVYEMLTKRRPFESVDVVDLLRKIVAEEPTPPQTWNPDLPDVVAKVLLRALSRAEAPLAGLHSTFF